MKIYSSRILNKLKIRLKIKDLVFAKKVCKNEHLKSNDVIPPEQKGKLITARSVFVDIYSDIAMDIARSFARDINYGESTFITIRGSSFPITDEIMDTYLWLLNEGFKKCCLYKGKGGAPLSHYIHTVLRSKYTKIDYIRHKTGINTNIPKCITTLGISYKELFLLLRQSKSRNQICAKLNIEFLDYKLRKNKIIDALYSNGMEDLLINPTTEEFSYYTIKNNILDINELQIINRFTEKIIPDILKTLHKPYIRFMIEYWGQGNSVKSIYNKWQQGLFSKYLLELQVKESNDFYKVIDRIISMVKIEIEKSFPKEFKEYPKIDIKAALSEYFKEWVTEQELSK